MSDKTPYEILGLDNTATREMAEKAWKKAVRKLHPDQHPEEERDALTLKLSEVNSAWKLIESGWTPLASAVEDPNSFDGRVKRGSEIPLFYTQRDTIIARFLTTLKAREDKNKIGYFFSNLIPSLLRGKLPKKDPLHVSLCAAVVIDNKVMTYMFHAPLPAKRVALIVPSVKKTENGINVIPNKPEAIYFTPKERLVGTASPFGPEYAENLGLDHVNISLPSRTFDMNKSFDLS